MKYINNKIANEKAISALVSNHGKQHGMRLLRLPDNTTVQSNPSSMAFISR
jgi:hypothetical protein